MEEEVAFDCIVKLHVKAFSLVCNLQKSVNSSASSQCVHHYIKLKFFK
jgi:hypothetical protein